MNMENMVGLTGTGPLIVRRCRFLDGPITQEELSMYQLGSKPFPRRTPRQTENGGPSIAERKRLVEIRSQLFASTGTAGTDTEIHWAKILDNHGIMVE